MSNILIINENYTEKAIAVLGNTKPYLTEFKNANGLFNARLKCDNGTAAGWIFPKTKLQSVRQLVDKINNGDIKPQDDSPSSSSSSSQQHKKEDTSNKVMLSREEFMYIMNTMSKLEREVEMLKKNVFGSRDVSEPKKVIVEKAASTSRKMERVPVKQESEEEDEDEEDEEEQEVRKGSGPTFLRRR